VGVWVFILLTYLGAGYADSAQQKELLVSAAADLMKALTEISRLYEQKKGVKVTFNFGSTDKLARQIDQGAPVNLFMAADVASVNDLEKKGFIVSDTKRVYARGRLALWTRKDSGLNVKSVNDLTSATVKRIALANPEHAPYGRAARQALTKAGVWEKVKDKVIYADNIAQTLQYAQTGNVDVSIVALSLSIGSSGQWAVIPDKLHPPIEQSLAVIKGAKNAALAKDFAAFIVGKEGRAVLKKYGFSEQ
jgi:molybdate transport system substrate-binding protein